MSEEKKLVSTEALRKFATDVMEVWKSTDTIRKIFAPTLGNEEFKYFMGMGISLGANPFKREIFAVKYGGEPAQIILARDFYRRKSQEQSDYLGHVVEAVYPGEKFKPNPPEFNIEHEIDVAKRYDGETEKIPLGAYCIVYRKDKKPFYVFVPTKEYIKKTKEGRATRFWTESKETMIKKVAESQGLRGAFQGIFSGTYTEGEAALMEAHSEEVETDGVLDLEKKIEQRGEKPKQEPQEEKPKQHNVEEEPDSNPKPENGKDFKNWDELQDGGERKRKYLREKFKEHEMFIQNGVYFNGELLSFENFGEFIKFYDDAEALKDISVEAYYNMKEFLDHVVNEKSKGEEK